MERKRAEPWPSFPQGVFEAVAVPVGCMPLMSFRACCSWKSVAGLVRSNLGQLAGGLLGMELATVGRGGAAGRGAFRWPVGLVKELRSEVSRKLAKASSGVAVSLTVTSGDTP